MSNVSLKNVMPVKSREVRREFWVWRSPESGEWLIASNTRQRLWQQKNIPHVHVIHVWEKLDSETDRITQTITGEYASEYIEDSLPTVRVTGKCLDTKTMVVEWTF